MNAFTAMQEGGQPVHQRSLSMGSSAEQDLFASISGSAYDEDNTLGEDDFDGLEDDESKDGLGDLRGARKLKRSTSTAEKKATHNAVERARRESLNGRFLVLADMLPGMNHVKRASKAAIVNKSIELIKELQGTETKLSKENENLRAELAALKQRLAVPSSATGNSMFPTHPQAAAAAAAAALSSMPALQGMSGLSALGQMPNGTSALGLQQMGQAMAHQAAAVAAHQQQQAVAAAMQQQQHDNMRSNSFSSQVPVFPGVFNGLFTAPPAMETLENMRSESGSPSLAAQAQATSNANPFFQQAGFFDLLNTNVGDALSGNGGSSPLSYNSPPAAGAFNASMANVTGGKITDSPSAASNHSISPAAYSPISLPSLGTNAVSSAASSHEGPASPTTFEESAALFAQFNNANNNANKASLDLQQFLAMQKFSGSAFGSFSPFQAVPTPNANAFPQMPSPPQSTQFCGGMNIPAWQMMMAHQHALTAYGGNQTPY